MGPNGTMIEARIAEVRTALKTTSAPRERLPLLDDIALYLCFQFKAENIEAEVHAREELRIAKSIGDKYWIAKSYRRLGFCLDAQFQANRGRRYLQKACKAAAELPYDPLIKSVFHRDLAMIQSRLGNVAAALDILKVAVECAKESGNEIVLASALSPMAGLYTDVNSYPKALALFDEVLRLYGGAPDSLPKALQTATTYCLIGGMHYRFGNWDSAIEWYTRGLELNQQVGDKQLEATAHYALGGIYCHLQQFNLSQQNISTATNLYKQRGANLHYQRALLVLGDICGFNEDYDSAGKHFRQALRVFDKAGDDAMRASALVGLGQVYAARHEWNGAMKTLHTALKIRTKLRDQTHIAHSHKVLAETYENAGDVQKSLAHYKEYIDLKQGLMGGEIRQMVLKLDLHHQQSQVKYQTQSYLSKTQRLERQAESRTKEIELLSSQFAQHNELLSHLRKRLGTLTENDRVSQGLIESIIRHIDDNTVHSEAWQTFEEQIQLLDAEFTSTLSDQYPALTPTELRTCLLLRINLSNKEIANLLNISPHTVSTHRSRIRRKMNLRPKENLVMVLSAL